MLPLWSFYRSDGTPSITLDDFPDRNEDKKRRLFGMESFPSSLSSSIRSLLFNSTWKFLPPQFSLPDRLRHIVASRASSSMESIPRSRCTSRWRIRCQTRRVGSWREGEGQPLVTSWRCRRVRLLIRSMKLSSRRQSRWALSTLPSYFLELAMEGGHYAEFGILWISLQIYLV